MKSKFKNEYSIGTRIEERRNALNLSRNAVCEQLGGVALSTLQLWEKNEREPQAGMVIKLAEILKTTVGYLLKGEQSEPQEAKGIVARAFEALEKERTEQDEVEMLASFESIEVSAGFGSFNVGVTEPDGQVPYDSNLLRNLGVKPKHCGVFWANGSSMLPTIHNGDQLLVDFSKKEVKNNKVYLVQNGDSVWVKRVKIEWDGVELISDNKEEYRPIRISADEAQNLQIIGQVVHIGHSLI
ncbi:XRE family transcriptional regulator [Glaesserella parasuis]|uniref:XRE family transcriptional regulator n=1 Tax=Glaesserella parasuis TaxID=738 RepID=UPI0021BF2133|nr:XRE family transcriptional regulator [Glaesserella parasuis]MCT8629407.1 XRE family transcriptional regulator [Glaesserella parasuis]MCT8667449.1 XRE family transcriptional regulator [Glaesserella parasuis]MCT8732306.1 XRE family transcriptional regulator [Glaesserella parasuis]MCT8797448.1 XRE family transcriptional regulator [Glaesserella parasuis]MCT8813842.1 XRE family transcriptional regulator [Glaesserella parasuis]